MSRWLQSVNTILEQLDDTVEETTADGGAVHGLTHLLRGTTTGESYEEDYDEEDYDDEEYEDEEGYDDEEDYDEDG